MMIAIIVLIFLLVVMFVLSFATRTAIGRSLRAARLSIGTWWNNNVPNRPTMHQVWAAIRPIAWIIAILIGLMLLAWVVLFFLIVGICTAMGSFTSGILLGFLIITVAFLFILKKIPGFQTSGTIFYYIVLILLVAFSWNFIFGWWSPGIQQSWARLNGNWKQEFANSMDKKSIKSEPEMGIHFRVKEDTWMYVSSKEKLPVGEGELVMSASAGRIKSLKADEISEGMTKVMLKNGDGIFVEGKIGWIPTRALNLNWRWEEKEKGGEKSSKASPPPEVKKTGNGVEMFFNTALFEKNNKPKITTLESGKYRYTVAGGEFESGQCTPVFIGERFGPGEIFLDVGDRFVFPGDEFILSSEKDISARINSQEKTGRTGMVKIKIERIG